MLVVGKQYLAVKIAEIIDFGDGHIETISEKSLKIEVIDKSVELKASGDDQYYIEPACESLSGPSWYRVKNLDTGREHWFRAGSYTITEL